MASVGSSFDFASDDVLCSFDEVVNHDLSNEKRSVELEKDLEDSGVGRELVCVYREEECPKEEIIDVVEKCMKKYTDNLIQYFEGINGRLTQLEIQCYKLERTMGEFRADSIRDQGEVNTKLKAVVKQLQEVHRSIQIVRDKQELAETQSELSKLQVAPKESNSPTQSQKSDMSSLSSASEPKQPINTPEIPSYSHLALALPHQIIHSHDQQQRYIVNQSIPFYPHQSQSSQPEPHYIQARPQFPDPQPHNPQIPNPSQYQPFVLANSTHHHVSNQTLHQSFTNTNPNYVQVQSLPQIPNQQPLSTPHPNPTFVYMQPKSIAVNQPQPPPQTLIIRAQTSPTYPTAFAYGAPGSISVPNQSQLQGHSAVYGSIDGSRVQTYLHPNNNSGMQNPQMHSRDSSRFQQVMQVHPYADIIEKAANIGYSREQVVVAINEMVDSGQSVDFNSLLDKLDSSFRAWLQ